MLPQIKTIEDYRKFDLRGTEVLGAVKELCSRLKIPARNIEFAKDGSSPVAIVDDALVIKMFAPLFFSYFETEVNSLNFLSQGLSLAPRLIASGSIDDWSFVLMSKLAGTSLKNLWPDLTESEIQESCFVVGQSLKQIHSTPVAQDNIATTPWLDFIQYQKLHCIEHHKKKELPPHLLNQVSKFLSQIDFSNQSNGFLHTEVGKEHVFFAKSESSLSFSGFIDFEPAMIGDPEYDFASVGIFLTSGNRKALRAFFEGYGILDNIDRDFRRRIMAYTLLHKYSNLKWYLEFMPNAESLEELADLWWAT